MLYLLVKKFGFSNETKIEPLLNDIFYKSLTIEEHLHSLVSLLVAVGRYLKLAKAATMIQEVCTKNTSKYSNFYLFQALALTR